MTEEAELADRIDAVRRRIAGACARAGRDPDGVRLLPVSKTQPFQVLAQAARLGIVRFGENRVQEMANKDAGLRELGLQVQWALTGPLQSNKVRDVAALASEFQALESVRIAEALQRRLTAAGRRLDVMIEVNTSQESAKHGLDPAEVPDFAARLAPYDALNVTGLMTVAANTPDQRVIAGCFQTLVDLQARLRDAGTLGSAWDELSMGMSGDFELAIEHGATVVRVGTAIFGARQTQG